MIIQGNDKCLKADPWQRLQVTAYAREIQNKILQNCDCVILKTSFQCAITTPVKLQVCCTRPWWQFTKFQFYFKLASFTHLSRLFRANDLFPVCHVHIAQSIDLYNDANELSYREACMYGSYLLSQGLVNVTAQSTKTGNLVFNIIPGSMGKNVLLSATWMHKFTIIPESIVYSGPTGRKFLGPNTCVIYETQKLHYCIFEHWA